MNTPDVLRTMSRSLHCVCIISLLVSAKLCQWAMAMSINLGCVVNNLTWVLLQPSLMPSFYVLSRLVLESSVNLEEDLETWELFLRGMGWRSAEQRRNTCRAPQIMIGKTVKIVDAELTSFKYLGSLFTGEVGSQADVNNRIRRVDEVEGSIRGDVR